MEASRDEGRNTNAFAAVNTFLWQRYWERRLFYEQEAVHHRMLEDQQHQQQYQQPETFFRPWEHPPANQQANIAVVRPFHSNQSVLSRVMPARENLHRKLLRGNHIQYQQNRYQYQQQQQQQMSVNCMRPHVNHAPESVILSRPLILETSNESTNDVSKLIPKTVEALSVPKSSRTFYSTNNQIVKYDLDPELENSNDLIICEEKNEHSDDDSDEDDIDCESVSSESSSSSQPLDLRTTKIPYASTAEYEISVIRSLSPVPHKTAGTKETGRERKSRKLKTKRRICTACNRTYLKTKNLRWHFKSKLHLKRVIKLGIDDPANQPDTWYRTSEQHDNSTNFLENIIQDESNI